MESLTKQLEKYAITGYENLLGKRVLLRVDVNVPLGENGAVDPGEDWRITQAYKTIDFLTEKGARVIIISHIGREKHESLKPIFEYMREHRTMGFLPRYDETLITTMVEGMQNGSIIMLENVRQFDNEEANDSSYLNTLIPLCDMYVNDAFAVSHRAHASIHDITNYLPSYFGLQFIEEVSQLEKTLNAMEQGNSVLVLGGAKFGTKLELLKRLLPRVDYALIGGALANVFLRERGFEIGKSFADDTDISDIKDNTKIILPIDVVDQEGDIVAVDEIGKNDIMLDIGPETEKLFETIIDQSKTVLWNGPMGKYEDEYTAGSIAVADSIARSGAFSVTGGGDTATVILEGGLQDNFDFVSTGGGAMLEFLVNGSLPAIDVILNKK